jgi:hypothetical protein
MQASRLCASSRCETYMAPDPGDRYCMVCKLKYIDDHRVKELIQFKDVKEPKKKKKRSKLWNRYLAIFAGATMCAVPMSISFRLIMAGEFAGPLVVMLGVVFSIKGFLSFQRVYVKLTAEEELEEDSNHPMQITRNPL